MNWQITQCTSAPICFGCRIGLVRFGGYRRKVDRVWTQRFRCPQCRKTFSDSQFSSCYQQKKRHLNQSIFRLLSGGYSQRRIAMDLGINRKTVIRKFLFLGCEALAKLPRSHLNSPAVSVMEFDDMETFEHSKCKPLSITLAVESKSRRILGFRVSSMPAKGKLAKIARKKYGLRDDDRAQARKSLFEELRSVLHKEVKIKSDMNPHYAPDVRSCYPQANYEVFKGRRGCVVGQGELKRGGFDPLFSLNHTCAMLRANINRLFRRTWCTTKLKERLSMHIAIYALYHNQILLK